MNVLIVEDDPLTREALGDVFEGENFEVTLAPNGREGLRSFHEKSCDLVCLDVMMPELSGYDTCKEIRKLDAHVPIIFISAKGEEIDKVLGLELGADDFIVKPFGVREVLARVKAIFRRRYPVDISSDQGEFFLGPWRLIPDELRGEKSGESIEITQREMKLLRAFSDKKGKILTRFELFQIGWDLDHLPNSRTLDQHIALLRKKIEEDTKSPKLIQTVQGVGYRYP
jgi:two-component system alkaline phosphatase synthesis response regulator PhoP